MLHFAQHDSRVVIPSALFCHSERSEESIAWMLRFAQHDKSGKHGCFTSFSMTRPKMSFRALFFVIPSACEESIAWMLRFAQHDKSGKHGCFTSFSMTAVWSFRALFFVIPNAVRNPLRGCLRSVQHDSRVVIPSALFCHSERSEESIAWISNRLQRKTPQGLLNP
jgi:hypothetical protein